MDSWMTTRKDSAAPCTSWILLPFTGTRQCRASTITPASSRTLLLQYYEDICRPFISRHYFCSFTLAIYYTYRVKNLAPVKSSGAQPAGKEPRVSLALKRSYHKWQFHSAATIATSNLLPFQSCFKCGKANTTLLSLLCFPEAQLSVLPHSFPCSTWCSVISYPSSELSNEAVTAGKDRLCSTCSWALLPCTKCSRDVVHGNWLSKMPLLSLALQSVGIIFLIQATDSIIKEQRNISGLLPLHTPFTWAHWGMYKLQGACFVAHILMQIIYLRACLLA